MGTTYYNATKNGNWSDSESWDKVPENTVGMYNTINIMNNCTITIPSDQTVTLDSALVQMSYGTLVVEGTLNVNIVSNTWQMSTIAGGFQGPGNILVKSGGVVNITSLGNPPLSIWGTVIAIAMSKGSFTNYGTINISASSNGSQGIGIQYDSNVPFDNYGIINTSYDHKHSPSTAILMRVGTLNNHAEGSILIGEQQSTGSILEVSAGATVNNEGVINNFGQISNNGTLNNSKDITFNFPLATYTGKPVSGTNETILLEGTISGDEASTLSTISNSYEITGSLTINKGAALVIENGQTVTNSGTLDNDGTIIIEPGGVFNGSHGQVIHQPVISSFIPTTVVPEMWLEIAGSGFLEGGKVIFKGDIQASLDPASSDTKAYVKVPKGATSGAIIIECSGVKSFPSAEALTVDAPPLITPLPNPVFPPKTSGAMSELVEDVSLTQSATDTTPNAMTIKNTAAANSKDGSSFKGFVSTTERNETIIFELNNPGHMHNHGGVWVQGGGMPSVPPMVANGLTGLSNAPAQATDTDESARLIAVGTVPLSKDGSAGSQPFNSENTNPIFLSKDGGKTWGKVDSIATSTDVDNVTQYIGVTRYNSSSNDKNVAIGIDTNNTDGIIFSTVSSDGGSTWAAGKKITDKNDVVSKITACDGSVYLVKQTSAGTQTTNSANQRVVRASTECFVSRNGSDFTLLGNLIAPQLPDDGSLTSFVLTGAACSSNRIITFYIGSTQKRGPQTYSYWMCETELNTDGSISVNHIAKIPTSGVNSQNFKSLNGVWAPIAVTFNSTVSKFLAVSNNGAIWSRDDLDQQKGPYPQPGTTTGWQLVKSSSQTPQFNKTVALHELLVTADQRSFFISGIDKIAITLTY